MKNPTIEQLGQEAAQARQEGRFEDARQSAEKTVALCREAEPNQKLVRALMLLGQIERDTACQKSVESAPPKIGSKCTT